MAVNFYDDHGIRFEYPPAWELDVADDGPRTTVTVQAPGGLAFAMVTLDESRPAPADLADEALEAMREEYPGLDAAPALEVIDGHRAVGHDLEFFSLDLLIACAIRGFRTARRTVLFFGQWSEPVGGDDEKSADPADILRAVRASLEETDAG